MACVGRWRSFLLFACMASALVALNARAAFASERQINLEPYAGRLRQVAVNVGGTDRKFLFDTGGGHTIISPAVATAVGCRPAGRLLALRMSGEQFETLKCESVRFSVDGLSAGPETVGVFDLNSMLPKSLPPVDGLISLKTFEGQRIALDLQSNKLTIDVAHISRPGRVYEFPCRIATGVDGSDFVLFAGIQRRSAILWFEVDSGNLDAVLIARHAAPELGLSVTDSASPDKVELGLGAAPTAHIDAHVADIIYDGALNAQFLQLGVLFADLRHRPQCRWSPHDASISR